MTMCWTVNIHAGRSRDFASFDWYRPTFRVLWSKCGRNWAPVGLGCCRLHRGTNKRCTNWENRTLIRRREMRSFQRVHQPENWSFCCYKCTDNHVNGCLPCFRASLHFDKALRPAQGKLCLYHVTIHTVTSQRVCYVGILAIHEQKFDAHLRSKQEVNSMKQHSPRALSNYGHKNEPVSITTR